MWDRSARGVCVAQQKEAERWLARSPALSCSGSPPSWSSSSLLSAGSLRRARSTRRTRALHPPLRQSTGGASTNAPLLRSQRATSLQALLKRVQATCLTRREQHNQLSPSHPHRNCCSCCVSKTQHSRSRWPSFANLDVFLLRFVKAGSPHRHCRSRNSRWWRILRGKLCVRAISRRPL